MTALTDNSEFLKYLVIAVCGVVSAHWGWSNRKAQYERDLADRDRANRQFVKIGNNEHAPNSISTYFGLGRQNALNTDFARHQAIQSMLANHDYDNLPQPGRPGATLMRQNARAPPYTQTMWTMAENTYDNALRAGRDSVPVFPGGRSVIEGRDDNRGYAQIRQDFRRQRQQNNFND